MRVSVVVPVKDDMRVFDCVSSILAGRLADRVDAAPFQIVVVDNRSSPAFRRLLDERLADRAEILSEPASGAFAARNRGLAAASGDLVFFTDADCLVRPGWIAAGIAAIAATGADIIQGFSGSIGRTPADRLIQGRYGAQFRRVRPGLPVECDTRNLAVRREVFDVLPFNSCFRRVGDTEFGLRAESMGFSLAYWPHMRVDHAHDCSLAIFVAKQVCHGWGAQRLMREHPGLPWHGGQLKRVAQVTRRLPALPGLGSTGDRLARLAVRGARSLDRRAARVPYRPALAATTILDKTAALAGHLLYQSRRDEPSPSEFLGHQLSRD